MAIYPVLPTRTGADPVPVNGIEIDRAEDGTAYGRSFYTGDKMRFEIEHPGLTATQKTTLETFYADNRLLEIDYESPVDGQTYTCLFTGRPLFSLMPGKRFWTATVRLEEV